MLSKINFPTILTLLRLVLSPLALPILLVYFLPFNIFWINILLTLLFLILSLTDFLDGFFARKFKLETKLGRALDPIADKFLISSSLISLLAINKIYFLWVLIIIGREFFMMGLRQLALENNFSLHVSFFGKIKTLLQIGMIAFIILNPYQSLAFNSHWNLIEFALILITILLAIYSAWQYYESFRNQIIKTHSH